MTVKIREQLRSIAVSSGLGLWTAFLVAAGTALTENALSSPQASWAWFQAHWWGILIGYAVGAATSSAHRAQQAATRVDNTVTLTDGQTAVVTPPAKQP